MTFGSFLKRCLCCTSTSEDETDFIVDSQTAVGRPSGRSYTVNSKAPSATATEQIQDVPTLIVTRPLDDEFCASTSTLLLTSERSASASDNTSTTSYCFKNAKSTTYEACVQGNASKESVKSQGIASQESINSQSDGPFDEVYLTDTPQQNHATLPRRSNSPLPHERDLLDRDRFSLNRSGLQTMQPDKNMKRYVDMRFSSVVIAIPEQNVHLVKNKNRVIIKACESPILINSARSESMASVYSGAGEGTRGNVTVRGEVQISLVYNYRLGALEVGVKRCRELAPVDVKRNRSDPYVKVYLLPDKSKAGKRKTKVKKNTLNPVFEETLSFVQPLASLSARTLWLSVWHADMFGRNDFLGEVTLPLADVVFDDPAPMWYKLHERTEQFDEQQGSRGDLIVALKLELNDTARAKGTLHVLVKEAKNLVATKPNGLADVFCKSYLLPERGRLAKQKTVVCRRTLNPKWEHTFTYRGLTLQELSTRALELSLWDRDRLASNDFMGAIRLSLGTGTYMGAPVNWMDSVGKEVTLWQKMMQRPNFWVESSFPLRPHLNN
ncbi:unnamed protein product [Arctia plantaginis]|uniref:C2 domain-containing protein n=2 Tax=Arctia plantaginis TaxID=874455 RepID=A0A8S1A002_ARCPL|nr:unnamed protein product [Arctia plantaginis]